MTNLIVNADDFGYSKGVNLGILEAHRNGVVSSTTLMVNMEGVDHAIKLAEENQSLGVGIHFVLDAGSPVSANVPSLLDENGKFLPKNLLLKQAKPREIEKELECQLKKFFSFGVTPTHVDSHHHIHTEKEVFPLVRKLANKYKLPIRMFRNKAQDMNYPTGIDTVSYFSDEFYGDSLSKNYFVELLNKVKNYSTVEIMTHPAFVDKTLLKSSSYNIQRTQELSILTDPTIKDYIKQNNFTLITYKEI